MTFTNAEINKIFDRFLELANGDMNIVEVAIFNALKESPEKDAINPKDVERIISDLVPNTEKVSIPA